MIFLTGLWRTSKFPGTSIASTKRTSMNQTFLRLLRKHGKRCKRLPHATKKRSRKVILLGQDLWPNRQPVTLQLRRNGLPRSCRLLKTCLSRAVVCTLSFVKHILSRCCRPVKEKTFKIWDGRKGTFVDMTDTMLIEARTDPGAHPGCIEEGVDLVLRILTNRVGCCAQPEKQKT